MTNYKANLFLLFQDQIYCALISICYVDSNIKLMINLQDPSERKLNEAKQEGRIPRLASEELPDQPEVNSATDDNTKALSPENESNTPKNSKTEEEQSETSNSNEKTLKKPDKILPCPRCNSMDTKFCYYNNYNVNQPRHFCKNCQRYWTAGGTMRNVPVGAGRRKNKNSVNQFRQMAVSEAFQSVPNGVHHPSIKTTTNGTVLTFGGETPLCESIASVLNIAEKTNKQSGFCKPEELKIPVSYGGGDNNGNDRPNGFHQIPCFPGGPWPYPWASPQWNAPPPPPPPPGFCPPGFPMPFYPPPGLLGLSMEHALGFPASIFSKSKGSPLWAQFSNSREAPKGWERD